MKTLASLTIGLAMLSSAQAADANNWKFKLYGMMAYVSPLSETDQNVNGVQDAVKASSEAGYNFGIELRLGSMVGIELDYLYASHDLEHGTAGVLGETKFQPVSATLNFHVPVPVIDLYGGPTVAYVNWSDLEVPNGPNVGIDPELGLGLSAGADLGVTQNLAVTAGLRWLDVKAEPKDGSGAIDVNPLFTRIGLAVRY